MKLVVRVSTSYWSDDRGLHCKKDITYLKRKSSGFNLLEDNASDCGAEEVFPRITNLSECKDGIYRVDVCNVIKDWDSGYVEDYDFKLIEIN